MAKKQYAQPRWIETRQFWRLDVQEGGQRKSFYSTNPSRRGSAVCKQKAEKWINSFNTSDIRFPAAWKQFSDVYKLKNQETSYNAIQSRYKAHLEKPLRHMIVPEIKKSDWQAIIDKAYKNGAHSRATLKGIATTIRTFCVWCASRSIIEDSQLPVHFSNPIKATTAPKSILQPDELKRLFADDEDDNFYIHVVRFLVLTGLRRGEVCALQTCRDYDGDTIDIKESISHEGIVTDGKTANANRQILLTDLSKEQIRHHWRIAGQGIYLFQSHDGDRISPRVLGNYWRKWRDQHGVTLTLHELRHTFISYTRLKSSISIDDLKDLYGHSDSMNTDGVYVHEIRKSPDEIKAEREKAKQNAKVIEGIFNEFIS